MALYIGNSGATSGLTKAIYDQIRTNIEPGLGDLSEEDLEPVRDGWRKLAHAVAKGVVDHIKDNMEVREVDLDVEGDTASAAGGGAHTHRAGSMTVTIDNLTFE